jgi:hypothetical protein
MMKQAYTLPCFRRSMKALNKSPFGCMMFSNKLSHLPNAPPSRAAVYLEPFDADELAILLFFQVFI